MTNGIHILHPGFYTTIQDGGRFGYAHLGVPESGAMDKRAYRLANALLNNGPNEAMLECTLIGPKIEFSQDVYFVITGAIASAFLNGEKVVDGVPIFAKAGQILTLSKIIQGTRTYLAFAGGLQTDVVLGSKSWYRPITMYSNIGKGMQLRLGKSGYGEQKGAHLKSRLSSSLSDIQNVRGFAGPEYNRLSISQKSRLQKTIFTVSSLWNRMAIQLEELFENTIDPITTSPVIPGTVQLTPSGKLIVLMNDCQTTGGYPRILQLCQESLDKVAQVQQGSKLLLTIA